MSSIADGEYMKMISGDKPNDVRDNIRVTKEERIKRLVTNYRREKFFSRIS